jgi:SAM-dependent methyltransferase
MEGGATGVSDAAVSPEDRMRVDVDRLEAFYATPLGVLAREMIDRRLRALWPSAEGLDVLAYGYASDLADVFRSRARRVVSASPAAQGAVRWPSDGKSATCLVDEERLPFPDSVFDRIIVCHGLEEAEGPRRLMRELWRIAAPEARILVIVAHRRGLWARSESTPFGQGRPYTRMQLTRLLEESSFQTFASARVVYAPPLDWSVITASGEAWEAVGRLGWPGFGGVLMIEAVKRLFIDPRADPALRRRSALVLRPLTRRAWRRDVC